MRKQHFLRDLSMMFNFTVALLLYMVLLRLDWYPYIWAFVAFLYYLLLQSSWKMWGRLRALKQLHEDGEIDSQDFRQKSAQAMENSYVGYLLVTLYQRLGWRETVDQAVEKAERKRDHRARHSNELTATH